MSPNLGTPSLIKSLCDESAVSLPQAIALARNAAGVDPHLHIRILHHLLYGISRHHEPLGSGVACRLLDVVAAISGRGSILPLLAQLLDHPDARVRSRVAFLVAKGNRGAKWIKERTAAEDEPRVRANAIEGLWGVESDDAVEVLQHAVADSNNRVAGNALIGLYRFGGAACIPHFIEMAAHAVPLFRTTAAWAMGETGDPRFLPVLARMLADPEPGVRKVVFVAVGKIKRVTAASASKPPLTVSVAFVRAAADGVCRLRVSVGGQEREPLVKLPATAFIIWDNGVPVTAYAVREQPPPEIVTFAFAIPARNESGDAHRKNCEAALLACLNHKRPLDSWVIAKYRTGGDPQALQPVRDMSFEGLTFSSSSWVLRDALEAPAIRSGAPAGLADAANQMLFVRPRSRGERHVILLHDQGEDTALTSALAETALTAKTSLNAVSRSADPLLEEACRRTDGVFCRIEDPAGLAPALEKIYLALQSRYELTYQPIAANEEPAEKRLRIQVHTPGAQGQDSATLQ